MDFLGVENPGYTLGGRITANPAPITPKKTLGGRSDDAGTGVPVLAHGVVAV